MQVPSDAVAPGVLKSLRKERLRLRYQQLEWFEAVYRAYLAAFVGGMVVLLLSSLLAGDELAGRDLADARHHGPALIGLVAAIALALGLRSGSRGGPLALEPAEARYDLLAPIDRRATLLGPAWRVQRHAGFVGAVVGAVAGELAARRLPGSVLEWIVSAAAAGLVVGLTAMGLAMVASGARAPRWLATLAAAVLVGWAVADLAAGVPSPTRVYGLLAMWPVESAPWSLAVLVVTAIVVLAGLQALAGVSLEAVERRTALVGQLRFAVTVQDVRTVLILRRQLAQERPRQEPWFRLRDRPRRPVWRRDWKGLLRFPATRLIRMTLLTVGAALALHASFHGARPAFVVAGLLSFLLGLEVIEPLCQEIDQADRADLFPVERGHLHLRHLPASGVALVPFALLGFGVGAALNPSGQGLAVSGIAAFPALLAGAAGAIVSVAMGAPEHASPTQDLLPPEVAGMKVVTRAVWPVVVALAGGLPVVLASVAHDRGEPVGPAATQGAMTTALVVTLVVAWLRQRDRIKAWWRQASEEATQARGKGRAA